jgi:hemoglobin-like flavoprotein
MDDTMEATIKRVQDSFELVKPRAEGVATLFYARLFEIDPSLEKLFPPEMSNQRVVLMKTLTVAVAGLKDLDSLVPVLQQLGRNHCNYNVTEEMYATVGEALLWTLNEGLGPEFTPEVKEAWTAVFGIMADTMIKAAYYADGTSSKKVA